MLSPVTNTFRVRVPARLLLKGDVISSGETVIAVERGSRTPRGNSAGKEWSSPTRPVGRGHDDQCSTGDLEYDYRTSHTGHVRNSAL